MNSLADVELQLVMHGLNTKDIIRLVRCNRRLLHAARAPFGWAHAHLRVDYSTDASAESDSWSSFIVARARDLIRRARSSSPIPPPLLQHVRLTVRWLPASHTDDIRIWRGRLLAFQSFLSKLPCPPQELDASLGGNVPSEMFWTLVFSGASMDSDPSLMAFDPAALTPTPPPPPPYMRNLRILTLFSESSQPPGTIPASLLPAICALPLLHTLRLPLRSRARLSKWAALPSARSLRTLEITDTLSASDGSRMALVALCPHLTSLTVHMPALGGVAWAAFFSSENMRANLRTLHLDWFHLNGKMSLLLEPVPAADLAASFRALRALRTLQLTHIHNLDLLLPHLALAPALRHVTIQPICDASGPVGSSVPSAAVLLELLQAAPQLRVTLLLQPTPPVLSLGNALHQVARMAKRLTKLANELTSSSPRFELHCASESELADMVLPAYTPRLFVSPSRIQRFAPALAVVAAVSIAVLLMSILVA